MGTPDADVPLPDFQVPAEDEDLHEEAPPARVPLDWRLVTVVDLQRDTPRTTTLSFDVPGWPGHRAGHRAGQHVDLRLTAEDGYVAQRSYSIASAPEEETLRITVDRLDDGEVSPFLTDDVLTGDQLELRGPIGGPFTWSVDDDAPGLVLLAGGSGIVPLMAMLRHRAARGSEIPARLLHSVRTPREAAFRRELLGLSAPAAAGGPGASTLDVAWTFTRMSPPGSDGFTGRIDAGMLEAFLGGDPGTDDAQAFVCGPTGFVEAAAGLLVDRGHDPARIHTERFGPS